MGGDIDHGGGPTWLTGSYDPKRKPSTGPPETPAGLFNGDTVRAIILYTVFDSIGRIDSLLPANCRDWHLPDILR